MPASFTARDVIEQLDDDARERAAFFPDFAHGCHYHVDAKLSVYGDNDRWAIVIEQLSVNPRWGSFGGVGTHLYYHGNSIDLSGETDASQYDMISVPNIIGDGPSGPLMTEAYSEQIRPEASDVLIRGQVVPIRTDENYYWARKIDVERVTNEQIDQWIEQAKAALPGEQAQESIRQYEQLRSSVGKFELRTWHFLRGLVPEHRELLLATEQERRRGLPQDLPRLLQIDEWDHPQLMEEQLPSWCESFPMIAKVLTRSDPSLWQPTEESNTHWRHWLDSGNL